MVKFKKPGPAPVKLEDVIAEIQAAIGPPAVDVDLEMVNGVIDKIEIRAALTPEQLLNLKAYAQSKGLTEQ